MQTLIFPNAQAERQRVTNYLPTTGTLQALSYTDTISDAAGRILSTYDSRTNTQSSTDYDGEGRPIKSVDADGNINLYYYSILGQKYREEYRPVIVPSSSSSAFSVFSVVTNYFYDDSGRVIKTTREKYEKDNNSNTIVTKLSETRTIYTSDASGRTETQIDSLGLQSLSIYDTGGRLVRSESRDTQGNLLSWTAYEYDPLGRTVKTSDSKGNITSSEFDDLGRQTQTTVDLGSNYHAVTQYTYDLAGRQISVIRPDGNKQINVYDSLGRVERVELRDSNDALISSEYTIYDANGRRSVTTDQEGRNTKYTYDNQGRNTDQWLGWIDDTTSPGLHISFGFDEKGNQTSFTNAKNEARTKLYDEQGRLKREFSPQGDANSGSLANAYMVKDYAYDARGRVVTQTEGTASEARLDAALANTRSVTFKYDPVTNEIIEKQFNGSNDTRRIVYHYRDDNGLLSRTEIYPNASASTPIWWSDVTYEPKTWRRSQVTSPNGTENIEYDANGRVTRIAAVGADYGVSYTYTELGTLKSVKSKQLSSSGAEEKCVTYEYDSIGRRTRINRPNGTSTEYTYTPRGEYASITHKRGSTTILNLAYTRDKTGLITQTVETREGETTITWNYTYDQQERLTQATRNGTVYAYTYDAAGNRLTETVDGATKSFAYNTLGQLYQSVDAGVTTTYAYDSYGNLAEEKEIISGNTTDKSRYTWDSENHLIEARKYNCGSLYWTIVYTYDDNGTRVSQKVNSLPGVRFFTSDNTPTGYSQTLVEMDESGTQAQQSYVWGEDLLAQSAPRGATSLAFAHGDNLRSIRKLTSADGTSLSGSSFNYEPYGALRSGSDGSLIPYHFTGQYYDQHAGLQYHRARWLNCVTANWLSTDPVFDFPENFGNTYGYSSENPICFSDPSGEESLVEICDVVSMISTLAQISIGGIGKIQDALGIQLISERQRTAINDILFYVDMVTLPISGIGFAAKYLSKPGGLAKLGEAFTSIFRAGGKYSGIALKGAPALRAGEALRYVPELTENFAHLEEATMVVTKLTSEARALVDALIKGDKQALAAYSHLPQVQNLIKGIEAGAGWGTIRARAGSAIGAIVRNGLEEAMRKNVFARDFFQFEQPVAGGRIDILVDGMFKLDITTTKQAGKALRKYGEESFDILYDAF